jgi:hypothetical protein
MLYEDDLSKPCSRSKWPPKENFRNLGLESDRVNLIADYS